MIKQKHRGIDMTNITKVINDLSQLDYESLTAQECVELMEEIEKLNTVIKQKLTNALLRNSRRYKPFYDIDSYSIATTPHGNKVFNASWKEKDSFGVGSIIKYETVNMKDFDAVNLSDNRGTLQLMNLLDNN